MGKLFVLVSFAAGLLAAGDVRPAPALQSQNTAVTAGSSVSKRVWQFSLAGLAVANALDVHSSWGKHEQNRVLAGPNGNFGAGSAVLKLGIVGGLVVFESVLLRRHPSGRLYRAAAFLNFAAASATCGVAARNYGIPRSSGFPRPGN